MIYQIIWQNKLMKNNMHTHNDNMTMPQAPNVEKSLLAMMTIDPQNIIPAAIADGVNGDWFYIPAHKNIWEVFAERYQNGHALDITSIMQHLADRGQLEAVGGAPGLSEVFSYATNTGLFSVHLAELRDKYNRRSMIEHALYKAYDTSTPYNPTDAAELAMNLTTAAAPAAPSMKDILSSALRDIDTMTRIGTHIMGIRTGFPYLDDMLGGLRGGTLNIIAARPGMGKTAFGLNVLINVARDFKKNDIPGRVLFLTAEMTGEQLAYRMIQTVAQVNVQAYTQGRHPGYDSLDAVMKRLKDAARRIPTLPLDVVDVDGWSIGRISQYLTAEHREKPISLVVVDYIQRIKGNTKKAEENTVEQIAEASHGLKAVSKRLNIPVLALAQVNRESAKSGASGKAPTLADLKGCGKIEEDADSVAFIHRGCYYSNNKSEQAEDENQADIILAKNRHGKIGSCEARFFGEYSLFVQP